MAAVYDETNNTKEVRELREELIGDIRRSMQNIFGNLVLNNIADPLGSGAFFFQKGVVQDFHYKNLSGGEKAAFDLILDVHIKRKYFKDTIWCIDEIETHLHTTVQGKILKEIVRVLPEACQLWVTTHSLGVLRAAQDLWGSSPGSVSLIDFDATDPDVPREITPSSLDRVTWEKMLSIALDDFSTQVAPSKVVVCEGSTIGNRRKDFDAEIYNRILGSQFHGVVFISGGSSNQVQATGANVRSTLASIIPASQVVPLCDRDDKSDSEVQAFEANGGLVLPARNLESYLYEDEVIIALCHQEGKSHLAAQSLAAKQQAILNSVSRRNPSDDIKSAAGEIYTELKKILDLKRCGNSTDTFMRDTLAPLIKPGMQTYIDLKQGIIDRLP